MSPTPPLPLAELRTLFGDRLQENVILANYTTARVGGRAPALVICHTLADLEHDVLALWERNLPFHIFGSGSNVLVSDQGFNGVILANRAHNVKIDVHTDPPSVWAESGANLIGITRQVALRGLSGLEWASGIPGTLGGALYGNAGANGSDMNACLMLAEILHHTSGKQTWDVSQMEYTYRSSQLKRHPDQVVILAARLKLQTGTPDEVQARMSEYNERRRRTQPPGASLGSMFKNPPGDYAGRLIEAAGLKGTRIGGAIISPIHANFFINEGEAKARDIQKLIQLAQQTVLDRFGVRLELEVEWLGPWPEKTAPRRKSTATPPAAKGNNA